MRGLHEGMLVPTLLYSSDIGVVWVSRESWLCETCLWHKEDYSGKERDGTKFVWCGKSMNDRVEGRVLGGILM